MTFEQFTHPAPDFDQAAKCGCSCCADAIVRANHDRNPFQGCNCNDHPKQVRCDCQLCEYVLTWGGTYYRSVPQ